MTPEQWFKSCPSQNWVAWFKWFTDLEAEVRDAALDEAAKVCLNHVGRCPTCNKDGHRSMECFHLDHEGSNQIAADCADAIEALKTARPEGPKL